MTDNNEQVQDSTSAASSPLTKILQAVFGGAKKPAAETSTSAAVENIPDAATPPAQKDAPQDKPPPMPSGPLDTVVIRNEFYRDGFRRMLWISLGQAVVIILLLVTFALYMTTAVSEDRYFATTADGRILRLVPLYQPNMQDAALMSWVAQAAQDIMTFGYHDYQKRLQQSSRYFTRRGWETFTTALTKSRIVETVEELKQNVTASPRAAPTLLQRGVINGKYRWIVKIPLQVNYVGGTQRTDNMNVQLVIERVPSLENPNGVGIEQWIAVAE